MSLFSRLRLLFSNYTKHERIVAELENEIRKLNEENLKLKNEIENINIKNKNDKDSIIFKLKREKDKLKEEIEKLKSELDLLNKGFNFKLFHEEIEEKIIKQLSLAQKEVDICVAWVTSSDLISKLEELKTNRIKINVIVTKDKSKENKPYYIKSMEKLGELADYFNVVEVKRNNSNYSNLMHNKYCIIDNYKVIDGSYNWSDNAKYNEEHIILVESEFVAGMYKDNFNKLKEKYENNKNTLVS
ncbi:hypothetical protein H9660_05480 [Clostridium sp. Sa3CUN1]|uniref:phospholipase D n=1 Tax=Clostridium gallinarum TaxID=2762246 RepID=A0ABR8Q2F0_9CLOT|nr:phospholipase D-like domain-containing protein [Clostridium gallinarum]MBD7914590.1 hypothetical protein [Clostridium gallinarum]